MRRPAITLGLLLSLSLGAAIGIGHWFAEGASSQEQQLPCVNSASGSCRLPFFALYSRPISAFGETRVAMVGYFVRVGREYYLFPTSEMARYVVVETSLRVLDERGDPPENLMHLENKYVQVVGRLASEGNGNTWGVITIRKNPQEMPEWDQWGP